MKLSKAQQEVVDKMREGWELWWDVLANKVWLKDTSEHKLEVQKNIFNSLFVRGVLAKNQILDYQMKYQLTEKYKTNGTETKPGL